MKHRLDWQVWLNFTNGLVTDQRVMGNFIAFAAGVDNSHTIAAAKTFPKFDKPVLLAWANEAPIFEPKWATDLHGLFPNSEIAWIPDSYGFVPEDNPTDLVRALLAFLEK
jgi:pimeloyl-ACP methyl ester carboxylesterase